MTVEDEFQQNLTYFKMNMLQAEIEMQGMVAENKIRELKGESLCYNESHFNAIVEKYGIYHNQFPFAKY